MTTQRVLISWSSGKDSAWTLHVLRQQPDVEIVGLLTTFYEANQLVAMHGVRQELAQAQAQAAGVPLWPVPLPSPCTNEQYETIMRGVLERAGNEDITHIAFGDLFLEDIRAYREQLMAGTGIQPLFPLWRSSAETKALAEEMLASGLRAVLITVDPKQLSPDFASRFYDFHLLSELPETVDPCGEHGEFHTFCFAGTMFSQPIAFQIGEIFQRDGFYFTDLLAG
jgi:uncharacterized protein (TIGR00290 family)